MRLSVYSRKAVSNSTCSVLVIIYFCFSHIFTYFWASEALSYRLINNFKSKPNSSIWKINQNMKNSFQKGSGNETYTNGVFGIWLEHKIFCKN